MRSKTYLIAFLIVFLLFIAANYYSYVRMGYGFCDDCFISFGFPFPLWEEGGFVTVRHILWSGLIADLSIAIWTSIFVGLGVKEDSVEGLETRKLECYQRRGITN